MHTSDDSARPKVIDPRANVKALARILVLLAVLGGGVWVFLRFTAGPQVVDRAVATVLRQPIELKKSLENLPAASLKGFALRLPYPGSLLAELEVAKGNELNVYLVSADQMEAVKNKQPFKHFEPFAALKTQHYRRTSRLAAGDYFLVVVDDTLGILSASSTDVRVHLRLEP